MMVSVERSSVSRIESACSGCIVCDGFWRGGEDSTHCVGGGFLAKVCLYIVDRTQGERR